MKLTNTELKIEFQNENQLNNILELIKKKYPQTDIFSIDGIDKYILDKCRNVVDNVNRSIIGNKISGIFKPRYFIDKQNVIWIQVIGTYNIDQIYDNFNQYVNMSDSELSISTTFVNKNIRINRNFKYITTNNFDSKAKEKHNTLYINGNIDELICDYTISDIIINDKNYVNKLYLEHQKKINYNINMLNKINEIIFQTMITDEGPYSDNFIKIFKLFNNVKEAIKVCIAKNINIYKEDE